MTAETITNTIGHILRFFVPPLLNLFALSAIVGFGLGVQTPSQTVFDGMRSDLSAYYTKISLWVPQAIGLILPSVSADVLAKFNPQVIILNLLTQIEHAGGWIFVATIIMLLFIAITLNYTTLWVARLTDFITKPFCRLCCHITFRWLERIRYSKSPVLNAASIWIKETLDGPFASERAIECARATFPLSVSIQGDLSQTEIHGAVQAWLSPDANSNLWLEGHRSLREQERSAKNFELYCRIYCAVSVVVTTYVICHLVVQKSAGLPLLLFLVWVGARLASIRATRAVYVYDLNQLLYHRIAERPHQEVAS